MKKIISFMHLSLDGFAAGPGGEMDWITVNEEIFEHVEKRIRKTNAALYGRVTYEMMEGYWPGAGERPGASRHDINHSAWYGQAGKIVLSRTLKPEGLNNTTIIRDNLSEEINRIKESGTDPAEEILLFGSPGATHSLMQHDLIDGYWLFVNPVILGKGIPLFEGIRDKTRLTLLNTKTFSSGVTELDYLLKRS